VVFALQAEAEGTAGALVLGRDRWEAGVEVGTLYAEGEVEREVEPFSLIGRTYHIHHPRDGSHRHSMRRWNLGTTPRRM